MPTIYTDFTEYATGERPGDWTIQWWADKTQYQTADFEVIYYVLEDGFCGKSLYYGAPKNNHISWDAAVELGELHYGLEDVDLSALIETDYFYENNPNAYFRLYARASGVGGHYNLPGDIIAYYVTVWPGSDSTWLGFGAYVNHLQGTTTGEHVFDSVQLEPWALTKGYWLRFNVTGNILKAKLWLRGDTEPEEWTLIYTDDENLVDQDGWVGIYGSSHRYQPYEFKFHYFGVGIVDDPAPICTVPGRDPAVDVTQSVIEVMRPYEPGSGNYPTPPGPGLVGGGGGSGSLRRLTIYGNL